MNEVWLTQSEADALYAADRDGVRQITGRAVDEDGGRCAMGVLNACGLGRAVAIRIHNRPCPLCGLRAADRLDTLNVVAHMNDHHGLTFSEIARKLGPDHA